MYIKSIVLDGFKSYGQRTEIAGFDPLFTAITGLNGSGKSNILDAICFVLGISNLSHVRASNFQDLIYRSGQAGVNKATVSVTFDNRNPTQSPPGFEDYQEITITRQVVIGGKNKYLINGSNVTNKKVQDLFCSIQLNVNNPHFLIMQGKVTKVLSMKPLEILGMIEEAAGTRVYEGKRQIAHRTITQKDEKLNEVSEVFSSELYPKLNKLREERSQYLEFQRVGRELQHMLNLYQAWQFVQAKRDVIQSQSALDKVDSEVKQFQDNINNNKNSIKRIEKEMEQAVKNSKNEDTEKVKEIEKELKSEEGKVAKANASLKSILDDIATEERNKKRLEKDIKNDGVSVKSKEDELLRTQEQFKQLKDTYEHDNQQFILAQKRFEALNAGKEVDDEGEVKTLQEQFIHAKEQASQANTEIKQAQMQLNFCKSQLEIKQKELGKNSTDYEENKTNLEIKENEVKKLESDLKRYNFSEEKLNELNEHKKSLSRDIHQLKEKIDNFQSRSGRTEFRYKDPFPNFNRNSVKGVICKLLKVRDRNACAALEAAAGGRLYNVVVDTEVTSKHLLERGEFQFRTTFIPLNKIRSQRMSEDTVRLAKDLVGKDNVHSALSLIEFDKSLQPAMDFIFGNIFICKDMNVAKKVAFHNRILKKCVTLDGDVCDPSGILSGGATVKTESILSQLAAIIQYEDQLKVKNQDFVKIDSEIRKMNEIQHKFIAPLEVKKYEVNVLRQRLQQTTYHIQQEEVNNLKVQIGELQEKIKSCKEIETKFNGKVHELEMKMSNKGNRESLLKQSQNEMKKLKEKSDKSNNEWIKHEQNYETLKLEITELKNSLIEQENEIKTIDENIIKLKEKHEEKTQNLEELKKIVENLQTNLNNEMMEISKKNKAVQDKLTMKEQLVSEIDELELEIKRRSHEIKKLQEACKLSKSKEADYSKNINKDDQYLKEAEELNQNGGQDLERRIRNAQEKKSKLGRTVNAKAQSMYDQEEKNFNELVKKKNVVVDDKNTILSVMTNLDEKKKNTLKLAHEQISKDFGSIFGTLLPGSDAKLVPLFGKTILDGLEVKVFLGGVWKNNLSELSGGQRSLAALSLILAMLLFNPAPLYILDEIDAALDLSHTQNIGLMLKTHFKQSQFIVVSLKDGMFSNANVLFRTKFVDGVSTITRTVNRNA